MSIPLVSVIIPCYNREEYIKQTINSVLEQTYKKIEIIVIDDGSTDNTREILDSYGNQIQVLEHPNRQNKGQSAAINLGIKKSFGKYIAILDSDDYWDPTKIEKQIDFLNLNPKYGVVYANGFQVDANGKNKSKIFDTNHVQTNNPEDILLNSYFNIPSNALIKKDIFKKAGYFDERLRSAQDHDMAIRLSEVSKIVYLNETLWYYRRHDDSQSGKHILRRWQNGFYVLANAKKRYPYKKSIIYKRSAVLHFRLGQTYTENKKYIKALIHFIKAGFLDPLRSIKVILGREEISSPHS